DRLDRAGGTDGFLPAQVAVHTCELLELGGDLDQRFVPALARQLAVAEEARRGGHAAQLKAFALDRVQSAADDAFGGTAADVDHQAQLAGPGQLRMGDPKVDKA